MKIEANDKSVAFIAEDDRQMFEVYVGKDGRSLIIRGINTCKVDGKLYSAYLQVEPSAANSITVRTREWE